MLLLKLIFLVQPLLALLLSWLVLLLLGQVSLFQPVLLQVSGALPHLLPVFLFRLVPELVDLPLPTLSVGFLLVDAHILLIPFRIGCTTRPFLGTPDHHQTEM
jgi:hypothetical protein